LLNHRKSPDGSAVGRAPVHDNVRGLVLAIGREGAQGGMSMGTPRKPSSGRRGKEADRARRGRGPTAGSNGPDELEEDAGAGLDEPGPGGGIVDADEFIQALWDREGGEGVVLSIDGSVAAWMAQWQVMAVGNRPVDHMARDLMHAALLRNHRSVWFQKLARKPPEWLCQAVAHLPAKQQAQAAQHLALRLMHGRHLYHVSEAAARQGPSEIDLDDLASLLDCRPRGVLLEWAGTAERVHDYTCGDFRACPWCLARRAVDLHDRLLRGPCRPKAGAGKHLLLGRIELDGEADFSVLQDWEIEQARHDWGRRLKDWARECGAVGGLLVHQVGPTKEAGLLHDLSVLAEVPTATADQRSRLGRVSGIEGEGHTCFVTGPSTGYESRVPIRSAAMPADHRQALRYLWAGTDAGFELERGGIAVNGALAGTAWGLDGAIRLMPWFLFSPSQWSDYRRAMRGRHLVVPFGSWRGAFPRPRPADDLLADPARFASQRARRARNRPLRDQNERVAEAAGEDRSRALPAARSAYAGLLEGTSRPVGRGQLREAMVRVGHPISERVARDLIELLRAESGR
jgi:hypothetical protein